MTSPKVIVISQTPPPTHGSTIMTKILLEVLTQLGREAKLVDRRFSRAVGEVGTFSPRKIAAVPSLVLRLSAAVVRRPEVCVFFCTNRPFSFLVDVLLGEVLRLLRVPTINYVHTRGYTDLAARGKTWTVLVRRLLSGAERSVCLDQALVKDIRPFVEGHPIDVIANTIEEPDAPEPSHPSQRDAAGPILFLSNLLEEKGADVFVDMALRLCDRFSTLSFALIGQPADTVLVEELRRRVEASGHGDRVRFLGPRYGADKWIALREAQLLVFPTRYRFEAQPLTIIEALSCGTPVIASDVGAISEMIDSSNGKLLHSPTAEEAVEAVSLLVGHPELMRAASEGALRSYAAKYSRDQFLSAWERVLDAVVEGRRRRGSTIRTRQAGRA